MRSLGLTGVLVRAGSVVLRRRTALLLSVCVALQCFGAGSALAAPAFFPAKNLAGFADPSSMVVNDFNQDGKTDLAVGSDGMNPGVFISLGDGKGSFSAPVKYAFTGGVKSVAVGYFSSGDYIPDLVVANGQSEVRIRHGNGNGTFGPQISVPLGGGSSSSWVTVGNFDGSYQRDGDIAVTSDATNSVSVLLQNGQSNFTAAPGSPHALGAGTGPKYITTARAYEPCLVASGGSGGYGYDPTSSWSNCTPDLNSDGNDDLVVANSAANPGSFSVLLGNGSGGFSLAAGSPFQLGSSSPTPRSLVAGRFDKDSELDIVAPNLSITSGSGTGAFGTATNVLSSGSSFSLAAEDFDGDYKGDVAVANYQSGSVSVVPGNGAGAFSAAKTLSVGQSPVAVVAGSFNDDSLTDLAVANFNGGNDGSVSILINGLPARVSGPAILGTAAVDQTLTAQNGTWEGIGLISFTYQWRRCPGGSGQPIDYYCAPITGAIGQAYTVTKDDIGHRLQLEVTATNSGGSTPALSSMTATVPDPSSGTTKDTVAPVARAITKRCLKTKRCKLAGTVSDTIPSSGIKKVQMNLNRKIKTKVKGRKKMICYALANSKRLKKTSCGEAPGVWVIAKLNSQKSGWQLTIKKGALPKGRYRLRVRASDVAGNTQKPPKTSVLYIIKRR